MRVLLAAALAHRRPRGWGDRFVDHRYPDHHEVALDVQTGVVVRCLPVGGDPRSPWLENDIPEVDA